MIPAILHINPPDGVPVPFIRTVCTPRVGDPIEVAADETGHYSPLEVPPGQYDIDYYDSDGTLLTGVTVLAAHSADDLIAMAKTKCAENIFALFPEHDQRNLAVDGSTAEKSAFVSWRDQNVAHYRSLVERISAGEAPETLHVDEGWPDPDGFDPTEEATVHESGLQDTQGGPTAPGVRLALIAAERRDGETDADVTDRLLAEFEALMNKTRLEPPAPLSDAERARYRELSKGLGKG